MRRLIAAVSIVGIFLPTHVSAESTNAAQEILARVKAATGGNAWDSVKEIVTRGDFVLPGMTGNITYVEDLTTGRNVARYDFPTAGAKGAHGTGINETWQQDGMGDIQLADPDPVDLYLTRRGYWQPDFCGAKVQLLPPSVESQATFDRVQLEPKGATPLTLWISRNTHRIERIQYPSSEKLLSDYREVNGVWLPFKITSKKPSADSAQTFAAKTVEVLSVARTADFEIPFRTDYEFGRSGITKVPFTGDNGVVVQGKINGKGPFDIVFDTGSINVISTVMAAQLGVGLKNGQQIGAFGGPVETQTAVIDSLQIGDFVIRNQPFVVLAPPKGLEKAAFAFVGYEVLRRAAAKIDYEHKELTLYDARKFQYAGRGDAVPLRIEGTAFIVDGAVDGIPGFFYLDTGDEASLTLHAGFVTKHDLVKRMDARFKGYAGVGFGGPDYAYFARAKSLALGGAEVRNAVTHLSLDKAGAGTREGAGNIGHGIFKQFNVTFDAMHQRVYFEKNANYGKPDVFNRAGLVLEAAAGGLKIMTVVPGSPAANAGLLEGDLIAAIDGRPAGDNTRDPVFLQPVGTKVHLDVLHQDASRSLDVVLRDVL